MDILGHVAYLLGFSNKEDIVTEMVNKPKAPGLTSRTPIKPQQCQDSIDSLAKSLFDNMFNLLVKKMNA